MATSDHPRLLLHDFICLDLCKELEFIHRSCSTVGYRANVLSTTLSHLAATNCGHLILPFISIRDKIKEKVENFFGCEFELFVEFTGLISWCKGAYIGWHSDDNRPYLKQRDFALSTTLSSSRLVTSPTTLVNVAMPHLKYLKVCYLNSHGKDFKGGTFHFKDGEPSSVVPISGDVLMYTADSRNIHSVDEVLDGERLALTLWFTRDNEHDEDAKIISFLSQTLFNHAVEKNSFLLPSTAPDNMYWFSNDQFGFDIRYARMSILGIQFFSFGCGSDSSIDPVELLSKPVRVGRDGEIYDKEFANGLHALQVVQFYYWKAPLLLTTRREIDSSMELGQPYIMNKTRISELVLPCNRQSIERFLGHISWEGTDLSFSWDEFAAAVEMWEEYVKSLHKDLLALMPQWLSHQSIFFANTSEL